MTVDRRAGKWFGAQAAERTFVDGGRGLTTTSGLNAGHPPRLP
jgi:hypothetical protein